MASTRILDDIAKVAGGTMSFVSSARSEIKSSLRERADEIIDRMDLVPREDFEKLEAMLKESRLKQQELEDRLDALESSTKTKKTKKNA